MSSYTATFKIFVFGVNAVSTHWLDVDFFLLSFLDICCALHICGHMPFISSGKFSAIISSNIAPFPLFSLRISFNLS